ncbi:LysR family transcriptional regulator ArgP [Trujillonella endophytica]|uniref:LysR family transcriptional regulator, chromosome initiation inhibitor n=1 Tax=Trujillonella endophytica TaxID=673521 RepID=A0A1H8PTM1_9ACTN|nr:LysR family transcriptional regulator ArgP [Trujillella endophytica]SEO45116.1 LysR family transcriptional regulator, chromosome initiation inhibitor [Trujillella endophytica]
MDLDLNQLRALDVTVREGTLEAAARALHVTPSAISQRLRALEVATGRVLLVRTKPVQVTDSGQVVLRLARQVGLLAADVARELGEDAAEDGGGGAAPAPVLPIAVNADSMATWLLPALAPLAGEVCFDLHREDQEHTSALLRAGTVMAAVTAEARPLPGCTSTRLGAMRYRPMAAPGFAHRWFPGGPTPETLAHAPVVVFDRRDDLQHRYLSAVAGPGVVPPAHYVPASADFVAAIGLGLGWGMVPDLQARTAPADLVVLDPDAGVDVVLHWQQWKLRSPALDRVREAVLAAAARELDRSTGEVDPSARDQVPAAEARHPRGEQQAGERGEAGERAG